MGSLIAFRVNIVIIGIDYNVSYNIHCMKSVQIWSYFWNAGKYGPEITPYLDTFHSVIRKIVNIWQKKCETKDVTSAGAKV